MTTQMFVPGRRVFAIVISREFTGSFCHPWHLGPANPWRNDGNAEFLHNHLKQPLSSSRQGMPGPRRQGRQQDLAAAFAALGEYLPEIDDSRAPLPRHQEKVGWNSRRRVFHAGKAGNFCAMQFLLDNRHDHANVRAWSKGFRDCDFTGIHR
uniref:Uncharacterized protein n=1 Tax=Candidatus Kentrum sp. LFY TaxID=2126342 RepID=A0A450UND6_9GAMM|nr:MAG: hypothetical protein BECKLFY1418B_GA0070995_10534 [Candidatus Kentron sp. LFY]